MAATLENFDLAVASGGPIGFAEFHLKCPPNVPVMPFIVIISLACDVQGTTTFNNSSSKKDTGKI